MMGAKELFRPFSWLSPEARSNETQFYETVHDISKGLALVLDLVHTSHVEEGSCCDPVLGEQSRETLMLMAKASARLLHEEAERNLEIINRAAERIQAARAEGKV
jgi:hypothetical protein